MSSEADTGGAGADASVFSVSDRVVWLGSLGTRLGTVRWLGELPQLRSGTTVGIELDYELPRGGTDGWHEGRFLFRARAKHGQLVSPQELVLEHRYFGKPDPATSEQPQPPVPVPGPNLTARDLIEDAMARVAAEQRVLRDRGRRLEETGEVLVGEGAGPAAYGAPLTMLEPPWRVAAAQAAARGHKNNVGPAPGRRETKSKSKSPARTQRVKSPPRSGGTASPPAMPPGGLRLGSPGPGGDPGSQRGLFSLLRLFRRRRSLSAERRRAVTGSPPPSRPARASSEDRTLSYRPRKRAAPPPPVGSQQQPGRPARTGTARRGVAADRTRPAPSDQVRHVRGKRRAPPPPAAGQFCSLQPPGRAEPPTPTARSLDRTTSRQTDTLVLEGGVLRPRTRSPEKTGGTARPSDSAQQPAAERTPEPTPRAGTLSRLSVAAGPRLWYKRKKPEENKPSDARERRGRRDRRSRSERAAEPDGELDWLADMVYARSSAAPPEGTVERRLQVLRHLADQEERSEPSPPPPAPAPAPAVAPAVAPTPAAGPVSSLTPAAAESPLQRSVSSPKPIEPPKSDPEPPQPPLPAKNRSPLRSLFGRDRSPKQSSSRGDPSAARPRFSMLANISALDREAVQLIEGRADQSATLPSHSHLGGALGGVDDDYGAQGDDGTLVASGKSHAEMEREKRETCQTIAMLVREKFEEKGEETETERCSVPASGGSPKGSVLERENAGGVKSSSPEIGKQGLQTERSRVSCGASSATSGPVDKPKESAENKANNAKVQNVSSSVSLRSDSAAQKNNSAIQSSKQAAPPSNFSRGKMVRQESYPADRNPFDEGPQQSGNPFEDADEPVPRSKQHGVYDNVVLAPVQSTNPFDEDEYPDTMNPFADDVDAETEPAAAAAEFAPSAPRHEDSAERCVKPSQSPVKEDKVTKTTNIHPVTSSERAKSDSPREARRVDPEPPEPAPRLSVRQGSVSTQETSRPVTTSPGSAAPQRDGDIPTLVRDLNQFLDTTMQTLSSPGAQRRQAALARAEAASAPSAGWSCSRCTLINRAVLSACQACGSRRPGAPDWSAEMQRYFGGSPPQPTPQKESLGIVQGGVAHRLGMFPGQGSLGTRSLSRDSATPRRPMPARGDHRSLELGDDALNAWGSGGRPTVEKEEGNKRRTANGPVTLAGSVFGAAAKDRQEAASRRAEPKEALTAADRRSFFSDSRGSGPSQREIQPERAEPAVKKRPNLPSTFVAQLLQREASQATPSAPSNSTKSASHPSASDEPDMDEVRRARLAFFAQRQAARDSQEQPAAAPTPSGEDSHRSSSASLSADPTDADDADDESESDSTSVSGHLRPAESRSSDVAPAAAAIATPSTAGPATPAPAPSAPPLGTLGRAYSAAEPSLPAIKEASPSDYLEETRGAAPPPTVHEYEDVEVAPRPWKLSPAEKARRRPAGKPQWRGDSLIVPDGRGGRVRCVVERDAAAPQFVIRDGVLYSQLPTPAAVESRALPPRDAAAPAPAPASTGSAPAPEQQKEKTTTATTTMSPAAAGAEEEAVDPVSATCNGPTSPAPIAADVSTAADSGGSGGAADRPGRLESDQGCSDLMLELQRAIDCGQHREAAALARRLAALKAEKSRLASTVITVNLFVEDRKCHVGPIPLRLSPLMAVHELKTQIERDYALPVSCQRWILDSRLVEPEAEHRSLVESGVGDGSAVYLYLTVPPGAADVYRDRPISTAALFRATPPPSAPEPAPAPARAAAGGRQPSASGDEFHDADDGSEGASTATTAANKTRDVKRSSVTDAAQSPSKEETVENGVQTRSRLSGVPNGVDDETCVSDVTSTGGDGKQKCCDAPEGARVSPMERRADAEVPPPLPAKRRQLTGVTSPPGSLQRRTAADAQLDKERDPSSASGGCSTQQTSTRDRSPPTGTVPSLPAVSPPLPTSPDPSTAAAARSGSVQTAETVFDGGSTVEQNGLLAVRDGASPPPPLPAKQRSPSSLRRRETVEKAGNGTDQLTAGHVSSGQMSSAQVSSGQVSSDHLSSGQSPARRVHPEPGGASLKLPGIAALVLREDGTPMTAVPAGSGARTADVTVSSIQSGVNPSPAGFGSAVPGARTDGDSGDKKGPSGSRPFQMTNGVAYGDRGPVGSQNSKLAAVKTSTQSSMKSDLSPFTTQTPIAGLGAHTSAHISPISSTAYLDSNDTYSSPPTSPAPSTSSTVITTSSSPSASASPASTSVPTSRNTVSSSVTAMTALAPDMHSEPMKAISMAACAAVKVTSPPATLMAPGVAEVTGQSKVASDVAVKPKAAISDVKTQSKSVEPPHGTVPQHNNCGVRETASVKGKKHAGESLAGKQSPEEASAINGMLYGSEKVLATKAESFRSSDVLQSPGLVRSVVSSVTGKVSTDVSSTAKEVKVAAPVSNAEKADGASPLNAVIPDKKTPVPSGKVASPVSRVPVATSRLANSSGKKAEPSSSSKEVDLSPKTSCSTAKATASQAKTTTISKTGAVTKNSSPASKTSTDASRSPFSSSASSSAVETANAKPTTTTVQSSSSSKTASPTTKTSPQVTRTTGVGSKSSPTASRRAGAGAVAAARAVRRQSSGSVLEKVALFSGGGGTASGSGSGSGTASGSGAASGGGKVAPSAGAVPNSNYAAHLEAMRQQLVPNAERFECPVCMLDVEPAAGVVLRECLHTFCRECLEGTVTHSDTAEVKCPYMSSEYSCQSLLLEIEIKALVSPAEYERHLARSLNHAKANASDSFHCRSPNCTGWCVFEDNVNVFNCPVCRRPNCLTCRAIHVDCDCKTYQRRLQDEAETSEDAKKTQQYLDDMVSRGDALRCPICDVILMKKWGCDWVRCSMCKNEVCWITAQPRWGPGGKGDISGGCKCGVNGKKCHPKCVYCH